MHINKQDILRNYQLLHAELGVLLCELTNKENKPSLIVGINEKLQLRIRSTASASLNPGQALVLPARSSFSPKGTLFCVYNLDSFLSLDQIKNFICDKNWESKVFFTESKRPVLVCAPVVKINIKTGESLKIKLSDIRIDNSISLGPRNIILQYWDIGNISIIPDLPSSTSFTLFIQRNHPGKNLQKDLLCVFDDNENTTLQKDVQLLITSRSDVSNTDHLKTHNEDRLINNEFSFQLYKRKESGDIIMKDKSQFIVSFIYGENENALVSTGIASSNENYILSCQNPNWKIIRQSDLETPRWILQYKQEDNIPETSDFYFNHVFTKNIPGPSLMYIQHINIPGYADGYFTMPLKKVSPVIINDLYSYPPQRHGHGPVSIKWDIHWGYGNDQKKIFLNQEYLHLESNPNSIVQSIKHHKNFDLEAIGLPSNNLDTAKTTVQVAPKIISFGCDKKSINQVSESTLQWEVEGADGVELFINESRSKKLEIKGELKITLSKTTVFKLVAFSKTSRLQDSQTLIIPKRWYKKSFSKGFTSRVVKPYMMGHLSNISVEKNDNSVYLRFASYRNSTNIQLYKYKVLPNRFESCEGFPKTINLKNSEYSSASLQKVICSSTEDSILIALNKPFNNSHLQEGVIIKVDSNNKVSLVSNSISEGSAILNAFISSTDENLFFSTWIQSMKNQFQDIFIQYVSSYQLSKPFNKPLGEEAGDIHIPIYQYEKGKAPYPIYKHTSFFLEGNNQVKMVFSPLLRRYFLLFLNTLNGLSELGMYIADESGTIKILSFKKETHSSITFPQLTLSDDESEVVISGVLEEEATRINTKTLETSSLKSQMAPGNSTHGLFIAKAEDDRLYCLDYLKQEVIAYDYNQFFYTSKISLTQVCTDITYLNGLPYAFVLCSHNEKESSIITLDRENKKILKKTQVILPEPVEKMAVTPSSKQLLAISSQGKIFMLDIQSPEKPPVLSKTISCSANLKDIKICPLALKREAYYAFLSDENSVNIEVLNLSELKWSENYSILHSCDHFSFSHRGELISVLDEKKSLFSLINTFTKKVIVDSTPCEGNPFTSEFSSDGKLLFFLSKKNNTLNVFDVQQKTFIDKIYLTGIPYTVKIYPGNQKALVGVVIDGAPYIELIDIQSRPLKREELIIIDDNTTHEQEIVAFRIGILGKNITCGVNNYFYFITTF